MVDQEVYPLHPLVALLAPDLPRGVPVPPPPAGLAPSTFQNEGPEINYAFFAHRGRGAKVEPLDNYSGIVLNGHRAIQLAEHPPWPQRPLIPPHNHLAQQPWGYNMVEPYPLPDGPSQTLNMPSIAQPGTGKHVPPPVASLARKPGWGFL